DAKTNIEITPFSQGASRSCFDERAIVGMNEVQTGGRLVTEFFPGAPVERIHVFVVRDFVGDEVPIPRAGLRAFKRETQPFFTRGQGGVALADALEHLIESSGQMTELIRAVLDRAHGII